MADQLPVVEVIGEKVRDYYSIAIDGIVGVLRPRSFEYLAKLAWGFLRYEDHWIHKRDIEPGKNHPKYMYQLRQELRVQYGDVIKRLILNDGEGCYRLNVRDVNIDYARLADYPDHSLRNLDRKLEDK